MKIVSHLIPAFLLCLFLPMFYTSGSIQGQSLIPDFQEEIASEEADSLAQLPFPTVGITRELGATDRLLSESEEMDMDQETLESLAADVDRLMVRVEQFLGDTSILSLEDQSSRELEQVGKQDQFTSIRSMI